MQNVKDFLTILRSDMNGIAVEDIPEYLLPLVVHLENLKLVKTHDDGTVLKPEPMFFNCPDQLTKNQQFPLEVFSVCGHAQSANELIKSGRARLVDDPYAGLMVVRS